MTRLRRGSDAICESLPGRRRIGGQYGISYVLSPYLGGEFLCWMLLGGALVL